MNISQKSYFRSANISQKWSFSFKTKISTGQLSCRSFQPSSERAFLVDIPVDLFLFFQASRHGQFLHIAFARDVTVTVGRWLVVNHKHDDYASTALTLVNVTNTTRLFGGDEVKEILVYAYVKIHVNV